MSKFALIDELLPQTVRIAAETVPFYAKLYEGKPTDEVNRSLLTGFPTIRKCDIVAAGSNVLSSLVRSDFFQNTSGSTGQFVLLHRSGEEQRFINEFFSAVYAKCVPHFDSCILCLGLPSHGSATVVPSPGMTVTHCVVDDRTAENCMSYLSTEFDGPSGPRRIGTIVGASTQLLLLTKYLMSRGVRQSPYHVRKIAITGDWLSERIVGVLSNFWDAEVTNRFSCSEAFGGATSVGAWNKFRFDPIIYPELVMLNSDETASVGELCVTTLFPFVQREPLIRYRTGDIFAVSGTDFIYHGRRDHCLFGEDGRLLISGADLYNLLDGYEQLERQSHGLAVTAADHSVSGKPVVRGRATRSDRGELNVQLTIATRVELGWFPDAEIRLRRGIETRLREICNESIEQLSIHFVKAPQEIGLAYDKAGKIWHNAAP